MFPYDLNDVTLSQFFSILDAIEHIINKFKMFNNDVWDKNINSEYFSLFLSRFFNSTSKFCSSDYGNLEIRDENIIVSISRILFNFHDVSFDNTPQSKEFILNNILSGEIKLTNKFKIPKNIYEKLNSNSLSIFDRSFWNIEILPILTSRGITYSNWNSVKLSEVFSALM